MSVSYKVGLPLLFIIYAMLKNRSFFLRTAEKGDC